MNKNRENFIKYSNDLYFHHLLVENERIRTLICQELVSDRKIISIKLIYQLTNAMSILL